MDRELCIWNILKKKKYISFDVFDTLIKRNVPKPKDIFHIVQFVYNQKNEIPLNDFYNQRIKAEKYCRENSEREEIKLSDIYEVIEYTPEISAKLMDIEIDTELQFCQANFNMLGIYKRCIDSDKTVILTSDMYLPESVIIKILSRNGITGYYKLYVSSTIGKQKGTSSLYKYVVNDLGVDASSIIHIGDGLVTDVIRSRQVGIKSLHIKRNNKNLTLVSNDSIFNENSFVWSFANNNITKYKKQSDIFRAGYEAFGPLILGFSWWIHKEMRKAGISKAFFLARDMYLFIDLYKKMFPKDEIKYLQVSRKSLRCAFVKSKEDLKEVLNTMGRSKYTVGDICRTLNIRLTDVQPALAEAVIDINESFSDLISNIEKYEKLQNTLLRKLNEQEDYTVDYLMQEGLFEQGKIVIVDIGWHGTIQNILEGIIGHPIKGLYLGNTRRKNYHSLDSTGYWFNSDDELKTINYISIVGILETMLFPNIGTTIGYRREKDAISPIHGKSEALSYNTIEDFQNGAKTFIDDIINFINRCDAGTDLFELFDMSSNSCMEGYVKMAYQPTLKYAQIFGNLDYEDNKLMKLAKPSKGLGYFINPRSFVRDYRESKWKVGFIKQLFPFFMRPDIIDALIKYINNKR